LGPRWTGTVPPARVLAGFGLLASLSATTGDLFKAVGRSALIWRIGLVHSATLWVGLAVLGRYGLSGVALAVMLAAVLLAVPPLGVPTAPAFVAATGVGIVVYAAVLAVLAPGDVREVLSLLA